MEVELSEVRQTFETNLFAVITMCQTFLPLLIKAKGTIVQIGSVAGVSCDSPSTSIYYVSISNISRSSPTYSDLSTMHPKQHCTRSVILFAWSWLHSGSFPHADALILPILTKQRACHNHRDRRCSVAYCAHRSHSPAWFLVYPYRR